MPHKDLQARREYQRKYYLEKKRKACPECDKMIRITSSLCCACEQRLHPRIIPITDELRAKRSENVRGEKHWNWRGGISDLATRIRSLRKYAEWRQDIYKRDGFKCIECDEIGYLNADHIKPFSAILRDNEITTIEQAIDCDELWDTDNGRTLCLPCHIKTETFARGALNYV